MQLQPVTRNQTKLRLAIIGADGSGKTTSALLTAYGLCGDWSKIAVIDTERDSASYHSYLGKFNTLPVNPGYHPEKLEKAINLCEEAAIEVIIIDSLSAEWVGEGGVMDLYHFTPGTDTDKCREVISYHYAFKDAIMCSSAHIIATVREKINAPYVVLTDEEMLHEFIAVVRLDEQARVRVIQDRTTLLTSDDLFTLTPEVGRELAGWCQQGCMPVPSSLLERIDKCVDHDTLHTLFHTTPKKDVAIIQAFSKKRRELDGLKVCRAGQTIVRHIGEFPDQPAC